MSVAVPVTVSGVGKETGAENLVGVEALVYSVRQEVCPGLA